MVTPLGFFGQFKIYKLFLIQSSLPLAVKVLNLSSHNQESISSKLHTCTYHSVSRGFHAEQEDGNKSEDKHQRPIQFTNHGLKI